MVGRRAECSISCDKIDVRQCARGACFYAFRFGRVFRAWLFLKSLHVLTLNRTLGCLEPVGWSWCQTCPLNRLPRKSCSNVAVQCGFLAQCRVSPSVGLRGLAELRAQGEKEQAQAPAKT